MESKSPFVSNLKTNTLIDGVDAIRSDLPLGQNPAQTLVEIKRGTNIITLQLVKDNGDDQIDQIFSQILSTFKFTEQ